MKLRLSVHHLVLILSLFLVISCKETNSHDLNKSVENQEIENEFKPAYFEYDNRIEKIRERAELIDSIMEEHRIKNHIPGLVYGIVVDDSLALIGSTGVTDISSDQAPTPQSAFRIASMTKSFTAMAIMKLKEDGKLNLEDPATKYVPELKHTNSLTMDADPINIEHLLTMTAGLPEDNPWGDRQLEEDEAMLLQLIENKLSFSNVPAFQFEYSNTGYAILGQIISNITGIPFDEYITSEILQPLGMNNTYWDFEEVPSEDLVKGYRWEDEVWKPEPMLKHGVFGSMGGLITSLEDFSKYVSFHLSAWPPRNQMDDGPIKRKSLRAMQTPQFNRLLPNARSYNGDSCPSMSGYGYGLGQFVYCNGLKQTGHGGALPGFGSDFRFFPEYGIGIMAFCNLTYTSAYPRDEIMKVLFDELELKPRKLPPSKILLERQNQIYKVIKEGDFDAEKEIWAENFFLDIDIPHRLKDINSIKSKSGRLIDFNDISPDNQLRGEFTINTENGLIFIFFTLTPEANPKVQQMLMKFEPN